MKDASLCGKDMMKLGNRGLLFKAIIFLHKHFLILVFIVIGYGLFVAVYFTFHSSPG